jgi:hypothetical protein
MPRLCGICLGPRHCDYSRSMATSHQGPRETGLVSRLIAMAVYSTAYCLNNTLDADRILDAYRM